MYQIRLHQLGYHGIAFCHTAYGRLNMERDDADVALPWKDLLQCDSSLPSKTMKSDAVTNNGPVEGTSFSFGKTNSLGIKIYRRLNIVIEEVSDVSRILLPSALAATTTTTTASATSSKFNTKLTSSTLKKQSSSLMSEFFQKYDIISLQPMNEPALQNICQLLFPCISAAASDISSFPNNLHNSTTSPPQIDIIVLEYATGSRGGYGLSYKIRKDYLIKALETGVTFELW